MTSKWNFTFSWQIKHYMWRLVKGNIDFLKCPGEEKHWSVSSGQCLVFSKDAIEVVFANAFLHSVRALFITWAAWNQSKLSHFPPHLRVRRGMWVKKTLCLEEKFLPRIPSLVNVKEEVKGTPRASNCGLRICTALQEILSDACSSGQATTSSNMTSHILRVKGLDSMCRMTTLSWTVDKVGASLNTWNNSRNWCE